MRQRFQILVLLLAVAILAGWWLAPPSRTGTSLSDDNSVSIPELPAQVSERRIERALQALYRRQAWSAVPPEEEAVEGTDAGEAESQPVPEGLDRFTLVGIIRVQGKPPEALLLDAAAQENERAPSFRARAGETLRDTEVRLERIERARVQVTLADESHWLALFERGATETALPDDTLSE